MNKEFEVKGVAFIEFDKRFDSIRNMEIEDFKNIAFNCSLNGLLPFDKKMKKMISFDDLESRILRDQKVGEELSFSFIARSLPMEVTFFRNIQKDEFWRGNEIDGYDVLLESLDYKAFSLCSLKDERWKSGEPEIGFYIKMFYKLLDGFMVHQMYGR
jgi:hypothetical protein